ncbi:hypothetical protein VTJ04DRAFT_7570 [Mycothermus thermophilus]|uniref:uncharacterized protein n=1 Tax=Humicola insolens TaxID=85995 RepID=UPI0037440722
MQRRDAAIEINSASNLLTTTPHSFRPIGSRYRTASPAACFESTVIRFCICNSASVAFLTKRATNKHSLTSSPTNGPPNRHHHPPTYQPTYSRYNRLGPTSRAGAWCCCMCSVASHALFAFTRLPHFPANPIHSQPRYRASTQLARQLQS